MRIPGGVHRREARARRQKSDQSLPPTIPLTPRALSRTDSKKFPNPALRDFVEHPSSPRHTLGVTPGLRAGVPAARCPGGASWIRISRRSCATGSSMGKTASTPDVIYDAMRLLRSINAAARSKRGCCFSRTVHTSRDVAARLPRRYGRVWRWRRADRWRERRRSLGPLGPETRSRCSSSGLPAEGPVR